jgi:hypothetical protein
VIGQRITVIGGPFASLNADLISDDAQGLRLSVELFGSRVEVVVPPCDVVLPRELHRRGTHTTRPLPVNPVTYIPELAPLARTTVRLHPRPCSPTSADSSVGGPLRWPTDEPWPVCTSPDHYDGAPDDPDRPGATSMVAVLQLYARDVPQLPCPPGMDILQLLWCPFDHPQADGGAWPRPEVRWRSEASLAAQHPTSPTAPANNRHGYVPRPCLIDPEPVIEYPAEDLPGLYDQHQAAIDRIEAETGWSFSYHLSVAPGIKVGGYPRWTQFPDWPVCDCGTRMDHLLTVASVESDGESWRRWMPLEEVGHAGGKGFNATDLCIGDVGSMYLFVCASCPNMPHQVRFDCS